MRRRSPSSPTPTPAPTPAPAPVVPAPAADGLVERQRTMFAELQHRVANNMQFASALLSMQKRKAGIVKGMTGGILQLLKAAGVG